MFDVEVPIHLAKVAHQDFLTRDIIMGANITTASRQPVKRMEATLIFCRIQVILESDQQIQSCGIKTH
jgi:hypothetical protein